LLLKAAMPLLASASATTQGKALVEVCTVYGVARVPLDAVGGVPAQDHVTPHGGETCALAALVAIAPADLPMPGAMPPTPREAPTSPALAPEPVVDACASWAARLQHGPPAVA
jgi:hypothetical protein